MKFNFSLFRALLILENPQSPEDVKSAFERAFGEASTDMTDIAMSHGIIESTIGDIEDNAVPADVSLDKESLEFKSEYHLPGELVKLIKSYIESCYEVLMKDQPDKVTGAGSSIKSSTYFYRLKGEVYLITADASNLSTKLNTGMLSKLDPTWRAAFIELTRPFKNLKDEDLKKTIYHAFYVIARTKEDHDIPKAYRIDYDGIFASTTKARPVIPARPAGSGGGGVKTRVEISPYAGTAEFNVGTAPTLVGRGVRGESRTHSLQRNSDIRRLRRIIREVLETI